jgi:hypothetical protein
MSNLPLIAFGIGISILWLGYAAFIWTCVKKFLASKKEDKKK